nr:MAG TPA: hypothetical protein [Caudoviricetes sp.]
MTYIKVNNTLYPAKIDGRIGDYEWDRRDTKSITLNMTYAEVLALLPDNTAWSIVQKDTVPVYDPDTGEQAGTTVEENEFDNSEYNMSGVIRDNRDGTVTIKMGKPTEIETVTANAISSADLENAYKEGVNSI